MFAWKHLVAFLPPERLDHLACRYELEAAHSVKLSGPMLFLCLQRVPVTYFADLLGTLHQQMQSQITPG